MDVHAAYEVSKKLRNLVRHADRENWNVSELMLELITIADGYQEVGEAIEMEMIIQMQRDWVEALMEFVNVEDGVQIGQPLTIIGGSTKTGKSVVMAKYNELLSIVWDDVMLEETRRVHPQDVQSDFETQVKQEIDAWIKKQPPHKSWATLADSAREFWNERLN